ncbi:3-oxoacyl-reductase [Fusarium redolens]|uniref:3-oxoacyl-reductase n=1 Tax=Fusarium redolens TaxID=48865 RepID=A0A9P9FWV9_FUSRE|nr:3-oxoacyl-reductase [Fusarium redolens]KAH7207837.1 3-oxoacyl-reductase [Fusarium redolens]
MFNCLQDSENKAQDGPRVVIAITGGAQGIGLATARLVASRGASVSIFDSNPVTLEAVEEEFSTNKWPIHTFTADIRQADKRFGRLDSAVNAAGTVGKFHGQKPIALFDDDDWNLVMGINVNVARPSTRWLNGMMHSLRAELRHMQPGGSIVNIASNLGSKGAPGYAPYATSKHAGIRINVVSPGGTQGPLMRSVVGDNPPPPLSVLGKYGQPEEVAFQIAWLLGPESTHSSGSVFRVDGGEFC